MQRFALAIAATMAMTATSALAMKATDLDINGDGFASIGEVRAIFPGFTSSDFRSIDSNRDRRLSSVELNSPGTSELIGKYEGSMSILHGLSDVDQDGDRFASFKELMAVYSGLLDSEFRQIDANRDNRVSATELYAPRAQALVTRYEQGAPTMLTIMDVDVNDDFFVTYDELRQSYPGLSRVDFEMIDGNGDNRVASNEFYDAESQAILDRN